MGLPGRRAKPLARPLHGATAAKADDGEQSSAQPTTDCRAASRGGRWTVSRRLRRPTAHIRRGVPGPALPLFGCQAAVRVLVRPPKPWLCMPTEFPTQVLNSTDLSPSCIPVAGVESVAATAAHASVRARRTWRVAQSPERYSCIRPCPIRGCVFRIKRRGFCIKRCGFCV